MKRGAFRSSSVAALFWLAAVALCLAREVESASAADGASSATIASFLWHGAAENRLPPGPPAGKSLGARGRFATIPHDPAAARAIREAGLHNLAIQYDGVEETLASFSRIFLYDLTGRQAIHGQDPVYTLLSMLYEPEHWFAAEIFPVENPWIAGTLAIMPSQKWISMQDYLASPGRPALHAYLDDVAAREERLRALREIRNWVRQARALDLRGEELRRFLPDEAHFPMVSAFLEDREKFRSVEAQIEDLEKSLASSRSQAEAARRLTARMRLLLNLPSLFLVVPDPESPAGEWITPQAAETRSDLHEIGKAADSLHSAIASMFGADGADAAALGAARARFERTVAPEGNYPGHARRALRSFYAEFHPFGRVAWLYLATALAWALWAFYGGRRLRFATLALAAIALVAHTATEILRLYLSGHLPVSNMYESITFGAWAAALTAFALALILRRWIFILAGAAWGFLSLSLVNLMPLHETRIHALRAVLNSYWLNIHVTTMLLSYGAFLISALFAAAYLLRLAFRRRAETAPARKETARSEDTPLPDLESLELFAYRCVQVGWPLLTLGVFLGGVWAQTAWGRFWGWDPKETWALITWIVYTGYLHTRMVLGWRGKLSAIASLAGFACVLITWFGVSYLPGLAGGLHSYASPAG